MSDSKLSLLERYAYARSQLGFPQCISFIIAYPQPPSLPFLHERLAKLQAEWTHLYDHIDASPDVPLVWAPGPRPWEGEEIVSIHPGSGTLGEMLKLEQARFKARSSEALFHVTQYPQHLGITVSHELADGLGSLRLVHAILCSSFEQEPRPPRLEDTIDLSIPTSTMLGVAFHKLLLPKLPQFISSLFHREDVWPVTSAPPMTCKDNVSMINISPSLLDNLTRARDRHGSASIHAILQTAWTLALRSVTEFPSTFTACTPRSERQPGLPALGNFVSALTFRFTPDRMKTSFWPLAAEVSAHIKSEGAVQTGRQAVGMLAYAPKDWVQFFREQAVGYGDSWELSNLGRTDLPSGATDMAWAQPGSIMGSAINVSMLRHEGGGRLCVTWREGSAVDEDTIKRVECEFRRLLLDADI